MELSWSFNVFGASIMFMVLDNKKIQEREAQMTTAIARAEENLRRRKSVTPTVTSVTPAVTTVTPKPRPTVRVCPYCDEHRELKYNQVACSAKCRKRKERATKKAGGK